MVRFRATPAKALKTYTANQLRGLGLASGRLLRLELLPVDRSAETAVSRLPNSPTSHQKPEQILADVLVTGPAMLLGVTLNNVHHYFVRRENQPYLEMTERSYLGSRRGSMVITDANNYKAQLILYFGYSGGYSGGYQSRLSSRGPEKCGAGLQPAVLGHPSGRAGNGRRQTAA